MARAAFIHAMGQESSSDKRKRVSTFEEEGLHNWKRLLDAIILPVPDEELEGHLEAPNSLSRIHGVLRFANEIENDFGARYIEFAILHEEEGLHNWKRLLDAIILPVPDEELEGHLEAPNSLSRIHGVLRFANEIENDFGARYIEFAILLYEYAYHLSQTMDETSEGRGVMQFKTRLQKKINGLKKGSFDGSKKDFDQRKQEFKEVYSNALGENHPNLELLDKAILKDSQLQQDVTPESSNILPISIRGTPEFSLPGFSPEVKDVVRQVVGSLDASTGCTRLLYEKLGCPKDIFEILEKTFRFQAGNTNNQWEHLVLLLSNAHLRPKSDGTKPFEETCHEVCNKVMENFNNWCDYLQIINIYKRDKVDQKMALLYTALYLLIWGEAANVRFLPECLCYMFYRMAWDLNKVLRDTEYRIYTIEDSTFLSSYIEPLYRHLSVNMLEAHKTSYSNCCNYDDVNELYWSSADLEVDLVRSLSSSNFFHEDRADGAEKKVFDKTKKNLFVEHRTYLHLYHSFHRLWIFLILAFQILAVMEFSNVLGLNRVKLLLSVGPTYFLMMCIESVLDIYMMFGALARAKNTTKVMIILRVLWFGVLFTAVCYLYISVSYDGRQASAGFLGDFGLVLMGDGYHFFGISVTNLYIGLLAMYIISHLLINIFMKISAFRSSMRMCDNLKIMKLFTVVHKEYYVGHRLYKQISIYWKYAMFWMLVLACKLSFSLFFQIKPLVEPSVNIANYEDLDYHWHDFISQRNHNLFTILTLWIPVVLIYLGDIQIWYTLVASVFGGLIGTRQRLGEIHSLEMLRQTFDEYPAAYTKKMVAQNQQSSHNTKGSKQIFALYWNDIINCLREEDYINNREKGFLMFPSQGPGKWPLFLLLGKVCQAADMAKDYVGDRMDLWKKMDTYMKSAVEEAYTSLKTFLETELIPELNDGFRFTNLSNKIAVAKEERWKKCNFEHLPKIVNEALEMISAHDQKRHAANNTRRFLDLLESFFKNQEGRWTGTPSHNNVTGEPKVDLQRLKDLFTRDRSENIPKNPEACRRLMFFANSLFMDMPQAKPIEMMKSLSVLTSYISGDVIIYTIDQLNKLEDGISMLFYLQKVFQDEWDNFLERLGIREEALMRKIKINKHMKDAMELRLWASYRGQTLARTVRGMMYYQKAFQLQGEKENSTCQDLKFTYVVTCDGYEQQKQQREDILHLMKTYKALRVAFIQTNDSSSNPNPSKEYFSKLVKANINGQEEEIYKIKLPGNPWLGERKSENNNHAIIFTRGDALQSTCANQDNYFEEALKVRNLLEEFSHKYISHPPSILGVRAHVFTGSVSSVSWFASNNDEYSFNLHQRILANPLRLRMTYGRGDIFDRIFHVTRGGINKASRNINSSEDVFAGYNSTLRNGHTTHHEYIEVGIGCSVDLNEITTFEAKVARSNAEQLLSRDVYRLGQLFDFFQMMSLYVSSIGFYVWCMLVVLGIYFSLYGRAYLAFSGIGSQVEDLDGNTDSVFVMEFIFEIGIIAAIPIVIMFIIDQGVFQALVKFVTMQLQFYPVFYTFLLGTWAHYFGIAILHGFGKMQHQMQHKRSNFVQHIRFAENYRLYSRSHFVKGLEIMLLLVVCINYGFGETTTTYILLSLTSWFLAVSWLSAPFLFNPAGFEWQKTVEDFADWTNWISYKSGGGLDVKRSWETWWNDEQEHAPTIYGKVLVTILNLRFFFLQYGVVYQLQFVKQHFGNRSTSLLVYIYSWLLFFILVLISTIFSLSQKKSVSARGLFLRILQGITSILLIIIIFTLVIFFKISIGDMFAILLAFIPTGWAVISIAVTWKSVLKELWLWNHVRTMAKFYDAFMGILLFIPVVIVSWFPFFATIHTRLVFNQTFSRSWEISLILGTEQPAQDQQRKRNSQESISIKKRD